jgi:hypothetical protein
MSGETLRHLLPFRPVLRPVVTGHAVRSSLCSNPNSLP